MEWRLPWKKRPKSVLDGARRPKLKHMHEKMECFFLFFKRRISFFSFFSSIFLLTYFGSGSVTWDKRTHFNGSGANAVAFATRSARKRNRFYAQTCVTERWIRIIIAIIREKWKIIIKNRRRRRKPVNNVLAVSREEICVRVVLKWYAQSHVRPLNRIETLPETHFQSSLSTCGFEILSRHESTHTHSTYSHHKAQMLPFLIKIPLTYKKNGENVYSHPCNEIGFYLVSE